MSRETKHKLLLIDDEVENLNLLRRTFIRDYKVFTATDARDAITILEENPDISLVISDQRMASMTGTEFFKHIVNLYPDLIKILLTAYTDIEALVDAINEGKVYKYVTKPWDPEEFKLTVKRAIEVYELSKKNKELVRDLAQKNAELQQMKDYSDERVEEERLRISRELHDETCQSLASINLSMEICLRMLRGEMDEEKSQQIIDNILDMRERLKETLKQVRRISMDLRPAELDSLGFIPTVEQFINRYKSFDDTPDVDLQVHGSIFTLPQKQELGMFRLIQECLNNIKKHAQATLAVVSLNYSGKFLEIKVSDNGNGFDVPENLNILLQEGHLGLVGMTERVHQLNGDLKISSNKGEGTVVSVNIESTETTF